MTDLSLNDRAEVMQMAWRTMRHHDNQWVYDWTPGSNYGSRRKPSLTEFRARFSAALKAAWANMRERLAHRAACRAARATARPLDVIEFEKTMLENKSRWSQADYARMSELTQEAYVWSTVND